MKWREWWIVHDSPYPTSYISFDDAQGAQQNFEQNIGYSCDIEYVIEAAPALAHIAELERELSNLKRDLTEMIEANCSLESQIKTVYEYKLAVAREALEFYANANSWNYNDTFDGTNHITVIHGDCTETQTIVPNYVYGGRTAREALEKIK